MKKTYGEAIKELEVLEVERPAKGLGEVASDEIVKPTEAETEEAPPAAPQTEEAAPPPAAPAEE